MKFPCVELYFEVETGPLDIRIWLKTDNELKDGALSLAHYMTMDGIKHSILARQFSDKERAIRFLAESPSIAAFQVTYRHDMNRTATVVYREWP
jgi:hypothetical protein